LISLASDIPPPDEFDHIKYSSNTNKMVFHSATFASDNVDFA
jgi:hypothetical protein